MKTVLIVDDEKLFLLSLIDGLKAYAGDFKVVTAENGAKASACLSSMPVDLVITDLKMPVLDGFELLAHMSKHHPHIPTIVMTAFSTQAIKKQIDAFGVSHYIEKPVDLKTLASLILNELNFSSGGHLHGITLTTFLQLIEMEKKTCTLTVKSGDKTGCLYFKKGELLNAETGKLNGLEASYQMVGWDHAEIDISPRCAKRDKTIHASINEILMEGCRLKDEQERRPDGPANKSFEKELVIEEVEQTLESFFVKEDTMALEKHLEGLKEVKGYKAAGIMNFTGEMLASQSDDANIDLSLVGATFNDIFRSAHEASKKIGLDACKETVINTPKGVIIMRCSGVDAKSHFHLIGIMANEGNQALMKMQIEKMVPAIMQELV